MFDNSLLSDENDVNTIIQCLNRECSSILNQVASSAILLKKVKGRLKYVLDPYQKTKEILKCCLTKSLLLCLMLLYPFLCTLNQMTTNLIFFVAKIREINAKFFPKLSCSSSKELTTYSWYTFTPVRYADMIAVVDKVKPNAFQVFYLTSFFQILWYCWPLAYNLF